MGDDVVTHLNRVRGKLVDRCEAASKEGQRKEEEGAGKESIDSQDGYDEHIVRGEIPGVV